ncbi:hypothetical protein KJ807_05495 [Patescibacteria group bacterium]|nr:hypothetical protein [Patescibacteria group bacterium]
MRYEIGLLILQSTNKPNIATRAQRAQLALDREVTHRKITPIVLAALYKITLAAFQKAAKWLDRKHAHRRPAMTLSVLGARLSITITWDIQPRQQRALLFK